MATISTNNNSNQLDNMQAQMALNGRTGTIVKEMQTLAETVKTGALKGEELQKVQIQLQDLQRDLEVMKQMEEAMKKAMESVNKFPQ